MSFVGSLFDNDKGAGYQAGAAPIQMPVTEAQANQLYGQSQDAITNQRNFTNAINAQAPNAISTQNALSGMLMSQAQGGGPNPAQAALNQNTAANIQNQAAMAAGQRGASSNVGLMQRNVGQQGAQTQQNAVGQEATQQAVQQLNAQNALQNLAGSQVGQVQNANTSYNNAVQGEQGALLSGIQGQNAANVSMRGNQNTANASIAQGNQAAQSGLVSGIAKGIGSMAAFAKGGQVQYMDEGGGAGDIIGMPSLGVDTSMPSFPGVTSPNVQFGDSLHERMPPSLGVDTTMPSIQGPQSNAGQILQNQAPQVQSATPAGAGSPQNSGAAAIAQEWNDAGNAPFAAGQKAQSQAMSPMGGGSSGGGGGGGGGMMSMLPMLAALKDGGPVKAMLSPGEEYLSPQAAQAVAQGKADPMKVGKKVPGSPKVKGDSLKNDVVPATLETGGVVIPNHIMQSKDPAENARRFVAAIVAKQGLKRAKK